MLTSLTMTGKLNVVAFTFAFLVFARHDLSLDFIFI